MADTDSAPDNERRTEGRRDELHGGTAPRRGNVPRRSDDEAPPRAAKRPGERPGEPGTRGSAERPRRAEGGQRRTSGSRAAGLAATYLAEMTGKEFEGVVGIRKAGDDWSVEVEVLEMRRIPSTTDVLAVYEVTVDGEGELVGYERKARYVRGDAREERE